MQQKTNCELIQNVLGESKQMHLPSGVAVENFVLKLTGLWAGSDCTNLRVCRNGMLDYDTALKRQNHEIGPGPRGSLRFRW